jgi:flagellar biosynthetic protein FlhB
MAEPQFQEKTEPATPKRREDARRKGQVAKSRELASTAVLGATLLFSYFCGHWLVERLGRQLAASMAALGERTGSNAELAAWAWHGVRCYLALVLPVMGVLMAAAIIVNLLQVGFLFSADPLQPKWAKIDPFQGARRLLSRHSAVELGKSLGKIVLVGCVVFWTLEGELDELLPLTRMSCGQISTYLGKTVVKIIERSFWVMLVLAILDYAFQRWEFERNLKMTKQEVKEEYKQTQGDPQVKARIRSVQKTMARRRMMAEVPRADVVITNPEHVAVALRYDASIMAAPTVVAKGADLLAQQIKTLAREHRVPIIEDEALAQNLYRWVDIDQQIPAALYRAVAEILAHVYRLKGRMRG